MAPERNGLRPASLRCQRVAPRYVRYDLLRVSGERGSELVRRARESARGSVHGAETNVDVRPLGCEREGRLQLDAALRELATRQVCVRRPQPLLDSLGRGARAAAGEEGQREDDVPLMPNAEGRHV